jgi:hypothetical protein
VGVLREVVGVAARQRLIGERGEGDGQVDGTPDGLAKRALGRPGICGGGEHVFGKVRGGSDRTCVLHAILHQAPNDARSGRETG